MKNYQKHMLITRLKNIDCEMKFKWTCRNNINWCKPRYKTRFKQNNEYNRYVPSIKTRKKKEILI